MKMLLSLLFVGLSFQGIAQTKIEKKLDKYYQKADFEKCLDKAQKYQSKGEKDPAIWLYKALCYYEVGQSKESLTQQYSQFNKGLTAYNRLQRLGKIDEASIQHQRTLLKLKESSRYLAAQLEAAGKEQKAAKLLAKLSNEVKASETAPITQNKTKSDKSNKTHKKPSKGENVVRLAENYIGTPYKYGGDSPEGFDCSGFVQYVYNQIGKQLPHSADAMSRIGKVVNAEKAEPGDLVFFSQPNNPTKIQHVGIVHTNDAQDFRFIHAPSSGVRVEGRTDHSWSGYWQKRFLYCVKL